jgi:hypothetical protein
MPPILPTRSSRHRDTDIGTLQVGCRRCIGEQYSVGTTKFNHSGSDRATATSRQCSQLPFVQVMTSTHLGCCNG